MRNLSKIRQGPGYYIGYYYPENKIFCKMNHQTYNSRSEYFSDSDFFRSLCCNKGCKAEKPHSCDENLNLRKHFLHIVWQGKCSAVYSIVIIMQYIILYEGFNFFFFNINNFHFLFTGNLKTPDSRRIGRDIEEQNVNIVFPKDFF